MKTLVTFLGRVRKQSGGDYERALYRFPDGIRETAYMGLELARYLRPDRLVVLGTDRSQWEFLVLQGQGEGSLEAAERIDRAIQERRLSQELLDMAALSVRDGLGCSVSLRLIPYGRDAAEQREIFQLIADTVGSGEVHFDVTHAYRHLSMIAFSSAFMLAQLGRVRVGGLWYGALDMKDEQGVAPVVQLDGLLDAQAWAAALARYDATGDYGVFAGLLRKDGFPSQTSESLREAAFRERTTDVNGAAAVLRKVLSELKKPLTGASEVFRSTLTERLGWAKSGHLADHQKRLAWSYLQREDYLRAAIFALEACLSRACWHERLNPADRNARARFGNDEGMEWLRTRMAGAEASFRDLKRLRNCLAHGFTERDKDLRRNTDSPGKLSAWLRQRMADVLGEGGQPWPW